MDPFELPEDLTALSDDELQETLESALVAFDAGYRENQVGPGHIEALKTLGAGIQSIRGEQQARISAAEAANAELDELADQVRGEAATDTDPPGNDDEDGDPEPDDAAATDTEPTTTPPAAEPPAPPATVTAAASPSRTLDLSNVRKRQPRVLIPEAPPTTEITAAVDVPGFSPGQPINFGNVITGINSRATALRTAGGGVGQVISYKHPYPAEMQVTDASSAPEGTTVVMAAADQRRLPEKDVVASGGWCSPSETVYDLVDIACPEMLWDAPEIQLARGGLRYFLTPDLDVASMTWIHTEADDIAGNTKPCFKIPCPDPIEVRCDAVGVCLEAGILTQRHFPELINWYLRNAMVAHEIRIRQALFNQAVAAARSVAIDETFGALSAIYSAVGLQSADLVEKYSLCERISLEVVFPWWVRNLFLADLARQNGVSICDLSPTCIQDVFSTLGISVQFARGLPPAVPASIGGPDPATVWPGELNFLIYPAGALQIGRGDEINLGVIHDSNKFVTNDYTALFSEECVALINRGPEIRNVTVPICPDGATGAQVPMECAATSPGESPAESPAESP